MKQGLLALPIACSLVGGCAHTDVRQQDTRAVEAVLDDWHDAAAAADFDRYFGHMTPDAVFMGTDATERWTRAEFEAYAKPHFDAGRGWSYTPIERHVVVRGDVAWFDERIRNDSLGECRGTGVLVRSNGGVWRIAHDSLTIPIPNELAGEVTDRIRAHGAGEGGG